MRRSWVIAVALALWPTAGAVRANVGGAPGVERVQDAREIQFSSHALQRMAERGVTREQVLRLVRTAQPFRYYHQRQWKTGYFEPASGLFAATVGGVVITVFTDATPSYVARLKRAKP